MSPVDDKARIIKHLSSDQAREMWKLVLCGDVAAAKSSGLQVCMA